MPSFDANAAIEAATERAREASKPSWRLDEIVEELDDILSDIDDDDSIKILMHHHIYHLVDISHKLREQGK